MTVGILGLGVLGLDAARKLAALGFEVAGWSRTAKKIEGVATFAGDDGLSVFLRSLDSARPLDSVGLTLLARNNEVLGSATTGADGRQRTPEDRRGRSSL